MGDLHKYQAVVVDLDGTLYFQRPVRLAMIRQMALRFWRLREYIVVKRYRRLYRLGCGEAERLSRLPADAPEIVWEWMIERPLEPIARHRDKALIGILERAMQSGVVVIVCSDYPVAQKLAALRFAPDRGYSAEDLGCMKPEASGLKRALGDMGIDPRMCLVIGDREEKDGQLAANMGSDAMILPRGKRGRARAYGRLEMNDRY